jgi:hypothetical protein
MPNAVTHPTGEQLSAFGLGQLPERTAAAVARHLAGCAACRQALARLRPNSSPGKGEAARPGGASSPAVTLSLATEAPSAVPARPAMATAPPVNAPPELLNHAKFRLLRELGRGGMGVVYEAEHTVMDRRVAIKVIKPSVLDHPDALARFHGEVRAAGKLNHDNIVRAYDADQAGNLHLLVMEFVEGVSLAQVVEQHGPLPVADACRYVHQAAVGLQHAFEQGMVHRDIKPQNLMVTPQGRVKILDFGLARVRSEGGQGQGLTRAGNVMGTPEYMAPEQATDARSADTRADIYSLGCTLYCLLTGEPPFQANSLYQLLYAHQSVEATAVNRVREEVPGELAAVVGRMLAKDPARRYQTPIEAARALAPFARSGARPAAPVSPAPPRAAPAAGRGTLVGGDTIPVAAVKPGKDGHAAGKPARSGWWNCLPVLVATCLAGLALAVGVWLVAGVLLKVTTDGGKAVVVLEVDQPGAEVVVDGQNINVTVPGDNRPIEIKVDPGRHTLRVSKDGFVAVAQDVEVKTAKSAPIKIHLEPQTAADGFVPLFNGRDTNGWKAHPIGKATWEAKDGILTGSGGVGHLFHVANNYENFELHVEAMINDGGNSGAYFRTPFGPASKEGYPTGGYEARINSTHKDPVKTGGLLVNNNVAVNLAGSAVPPGQWFSLDVKADGPHVVVEVNGEVTADYVEPAPRSRVGQIALQVYDAPTVVKFRKIEIKELPSGDLRLRWAHNRGRFDQVKGNVWVEHIDDRHLFWREVFRDENRVDLQAADMSKMWAHLQRDAYYIDHGNPRWDRIFAGGWKVRERLAPPAKAAAARPGEWVPLFNGKDLTGWNSVGSGKASWTYERGALVGRANGPIPGLLVTHRADYDHLRLRAETMLSEGAKGWILLRCGPAEDGPGGYQSYGVRIGGTRDVPEATGALFLTAHLTAEAPLAAAPVFSRKSGEWFRLEIRAEGNRLRVLLDGKTAVDYTDTNETFTAGRLGLYCLGDSVVRFRNMEVQELPPAQGRGDADTAADGDGLVPLFNGKDLTGWQEQPPGKGSWEVANGTLACRAGPPSHLYTDRDDYQDFDLCVEARVNRAGDSGLFFWCEKGPSFPVGYEAQIAGGPPGANTGTLFEFMPGADGRVCAGVGDHLMAPDEWFTQEVIAVGNRVKILVNGKTAVDTTLWVKKRARGRIALQHFNPQTAVEFRKVEIKELSPEKPR